MQQVVCNMILIFIRYLTNIPLIFGIFLILTCGIIFFCMVVLWYHYRTCTTIPTVSFMYIRVAQKKLTPEQVVVKFHARGQKKT